MVYPGCGRGRLYREAVRGTGYYLRDIASWYPPGLFASSPSLLPGLFASSPSLLSGLPASSLSGLPASSLPGLPACHPIS